MSQTEPKRLSLEEIKTRFTVDFSDNATSGEIRRVNALLARLYHEASFYLVEAKRDLNVVQRRLDLFRAEATVRIGAEQRSLGRAEKMSVDERGSKADVETAESEFAQKIGPLEYRYELWRQVMENIKFVAKRVDDAIIMDASERKLMAAAGTSAATTESAGPPGNTPAAIWTDPSPVPDAVEQMEEL